MDNNSFRSMLKDRILKLVQNMEWVMAIWEGGSAATGYLDQHSDLDLCVVVKDDHIEEYFNLFKDLLECNYGITHLLRVPEPAWHGHSQCFYFLKNSPEYFYVDLLVQKLSAENRFLETDRHGTPVIWLNRDKTISPETTPEEVKTEKINNYLIQQDSILLLTVTEIRKQIARGAMIDAASQYCRFISSRLAGLLNVKYRPGKLDFGLRYADRVYPENVRARLEDLLTFDNLDDIEDRLEKAQHWAYELLLELREFHLNGGK